MGNGSNTAEEQGGASGGGSGPGEASTAMEVDPRGDHEEEEETGDKGGRGCSKGGADLGDLREPRPGAVPTSSLGWCSITLWWLGAGPLHRPREAVGGGDRQSLPGGGPSDVARPTEIVEGGCKEQPVAGTRIALLGKSRRQRAGHHLKGGGGRCHHQGLKSRTLLLLTRSPSHLSDLGLPSSLPAVVASSPAVNNNAMIPTSGFVPILSSRRGVDVLVIDS